MNYITVSAAAKVNLSLDILGLREDGYHEVKMIMQSIPLYDQLTVYKKAQKDNLPTLLRQEIEDCVEKRRRFLQSKGLSLEEEQDGPVYLTSSHFRLPTDDKNLAYQAAALILRETGCADRLGIHIHKRIPISGGLGGGSADGAGVLQAVDRLYELHCQPSQLMEWGARLGSDIPFLLQGGAALATGTGTNLTPLPGLRRGYLLIVNPGTFLSTEKVYKTYDAMDIPAEAHPDINSLVKALERSDLHYLAQNMKNVLEYPAFQLCGEVCSLKKELAASGALGALMSGSGATVFALYRSYTEAKRMLRKYREQRHFSVLVNLESAR